MQQIFYRSIKDSHLKSIENRRKGSFVKIVTSDPEELKQLSEEYKLDLDLLLDGIDVYESPRIEHDNGATYIFVRYSRTDTDLQTTSTEPILLIIGDDCLISLSRSQPEFLDRFLATEPVATTQKVKLLLQILSQINRSYRNQLSMVTKQIFTSRNRLEKRIVNNQDILNFIDIEEDLNEYLAALQPYGILLKAVVNGKYFPLHEDDKDLLEDLELSASELTELTKSRLKTIQNIREAHTTIATNNLNMIFKRLTSITIFLMVATLFSSIYGMNISLPLQYNPAAFLIVMGVTLVSIMATVFVFKSKRWL